MNRRIRRAGPAVCVHVQAGSVVWVRFGTLDVRFADRWRRPEPARAGSAMRARAGTPAAPAAPRHDSGAPHAPYRSTRRASAAWATPGAMSSATP